MATTATLQVGPVDTDRSIGDTDSDRSGSRSNGPGLRGGITVEGTAWILFGPYATVIDRAEFQCGA